MNNNKIYFYTKNNRNIVPCNDKKNNKLAKSILNKIKQTSNNIPERYLKNWDKVALYSPNGNIENAKCLILDDEDSAFHLDNKLNDLNGKEWTKFTCSWFIFNAIKSDIEQENKISKKLAEHPATFSPTMISNFINYFTKKNAKVLDPFMGIGSTIEACKRTNRIPYGIELNKKYYDFSILRAPEFKKNLFNDDCRNILKLPIPEIDFCITSPPYWDVLHRSTGSFKKIREKNNHDIRYSNDCKNDIGNIHDYEKFLETLTNIYRNIYKIMNVGAYNVIIVKNIKKAGKLYPLAWDIAYKLREFFELKDEKIWIQDKVGLAPYGYPYAWTSNILHHYCLIFRKS